MSRRVSAKKSGQYSAVTKYPYWLLVGSARVVWGVVASRPVGHKCSRSDGACDIVASRVAAAAQERKVAGGVCRRALTTCGRRAARGCRGSCVRGRAAPHRSAAHAAASARVATYFTKNDIFREFSTALENS